MFTSSAAFYDLIYGCVKDYGAEADRFAAIIRSLHPAAATVLDVACGTGEHARHFSERHALRVDGIDLDPKLVTIAREKNPGGDFFVADMSDFDLGRRYDVVTCLFGSIGYARTVDRLDRAIAAFARHLNPGGVLLLEPWFPPGVLVPGRIMVVGGEADGVTVTRMSHLSVEGTVSRLRFEYLVGTAAGIERAGEVHELGLFTVDEMKAAFLAAGLQPRYEPDGRGLYICRG